MRIHGFPRRPRAGFSVIELTLSVSVLAVILAALAVLGRSSLSAFQAMSHASEVEDRARRALERAAVELTSVYVPSMIQDPTGQFGTEVLEFRQVTGFQAGVPTYGVAMRLAWELDPGETDDGTDEDGDGLIDEGRLILTRNVGSANEIRIVLCDDVRELLEGEISNGGDDNGNDLFDERGFNVHLVGDLLTIRLTVESLDEAGRNVVRTVQTSVLLRNVENVI